MRRVHVGSIGVRRGAVAAAELRRIAARVLDAEEVAAMLEVEVALATVATVRELNRLYRGRDEPTDVLSFAALADDAAAFVEPPDATPSLGEVIVCLAVAAARAKERGHPLAGEVAHLLVHGLLHLLGYDHEVAADSARMQAREDALLASLGYDGQYDHGH